MTAESGFKRGVVELRGMGGGWSDVLWHMVLTIFEDTGAGKSRKNKFESRKDGPVRFPVYYRQDRVM